MSSKPMGSWPRQSVKVPPRSIQNCQRAVRLPRRQQEQQAAEHQRQHDNEQHDGQIAGFCGLLRPGNGLLWGPLLLVRLRLLILRGLILGLGRGLRRGVWRGRLRSGLGRWLL